MTIVKNNSQPGIDYPAVSCAFLCHDGEGRCLLHRRGAGCRDEHGMWDSGAGMLELGESFEQAVRREVREEYGAQPRDISLLGVRNVLREHENAPTHWVAVLFAVLVDPAEVRIGEPEKMDMLEWFAFDALPTPLHSQFKAQLDIYQRAGIAL